MNLLICSYNNYYNRIVKKLETVNEYRGATTPLFIDITDVNFNPADGVATSVIVGKGTGMFLNWEKGSPDYCIVYETANNVETINSRWFILDMDRTRSGQYQLTLRRDVLADFNNEVSTAPIYVEKGIINDISSPLLCNNESLQVNQIKTKEVLLKDKSASPWLCLYLKKGVLGTTNPGEQGIIHINVDEDSSYVYESLNTPIGQWSMYQYQNTDYKVWDTLKFMVYWTQTNTINDYRYMCSKTESSSDYITGTHYTTNLRYNANTGSAFRTLLDSQFKAHYLNLVSKLNADEPYHDYNSIWRYNDKIIKDSNGKYYQIQVYQYSNMPIPTMFIGASDHPTLKAQMTTYWNAATGQTASPNDTAFGIKGKYTSYRLTITEITNIGSAINFSRYEGAGTIDSPLYDIICMPYGTVKEFVGWEVSQEITTNRERSLTIMNSIATQLGSSYVLDFQLLPYCPIPEVLNDYYQEEGAIAILEDYIDKGMLYCYNEHGATDVILVAQYANISFDLNIPITIQDNSDVDSSYKIKYLNDCTLVRLCSPNYNGLFDFNIAKNGGQINRFNVDMTMRPFNPYIHINPDYNFLYGYDFNDIRGLICNGDFSLGFVNDAWIQYEIQNKNYQAIFDRQIQNMDVNNGIARQEAMFGAVAGTIGGGIAGGIAGGKATKSPYGAIAGAVAGTAMGAIGGALDVANLDTRIRENRQYAIDNFNLSLGNVRALPNSITKTSCLTVNNKLFPFVEIYQCSEEEKEAYYLKLKYDGMTVGKISDMKHFEGNSENFFKGQVIRIPALKDDNHVAEAINEEIMKGVYI